MTIGMDARQHFLVETCDVRGQYITLNKTWQDALARASYPHAIAQVLGEAFVAAGLLASTVKFDGKLTLQVRGSGTVHLLIVQVTSGGEMRGLARWKTSPTNSTNEVMFGSDSRLSIAIEANRGADPYQGIVPLTGDSLSDSLVQYFHSSEQTDTHLQIAVSDDRACGILLQPLPADAKNTPDDDGFTRAVALVNSFSREELLTHPFERLMHLAYHQERVRVFDPKPVSFECSCSRDRIDSMLLGMGAAEVNDILQEQGQVEVTCEFCDEQYRYDNVDADALFNATPGYEQTKPPPGQSH